VLSLKGLGMDNGLLPNFIEVETSTYCNRRCSWCPNSKYKRGQEKKFINFDLFTKIIADLKKINYQGQLALHNYNEPLLDPNLYKYLNIIKTQLPLVKIIIFTNGDYLYNGVLKKLKAGVFLRFMYHSIVLLAKIIIKK